MSSIKLDSDLSIIPRRQQLNATQSINYDLFKTHIRYINALSDNHSQVFVHRSCMLYFTNCYFTTRQPILIYPKQYNFANHINSEAFQEIHQKL